jgi:trimeric autotransporter adhesin
LFSNGTGNNNTAVANLSMLHNQTGSFNSAFGKSVLYHSTNNNYNTGNGNYALYSLTSGTENTSAGVFSSAGNTSGSFNAVIGDSSLMNNNLTNTIIIGAKANADASNKVVVGNRSVTSIGGAVNWTVYSDERVKKNISTRVPGLNFINTLRPVTFHYSVSEEQKLLGIASADDNSNSSIEQINFSGLIAQEVDAAVKKSGYDLNAVDKTGNILGLRYNEFIAPLIKSVQELSVKNDEKRKRIEELKNQITELKSLLSQIQ